MEVGTSTLVSGSRFEAVFCRSVVPLNKTLCMQGNAGVAQLVERNLAKVEVASSRLVSRSRHTGKQRFPFCLAGRWITHKSATRCSPMHGNGPPVRLRPDTTPL